MYYWEMGGWAGRDVSPLSSVHCSTGQGWIVGEMVLMRSIRVAKVASAEITFWNRGVIKKDWEFCYQPLQHLHRCLFCKTGQDIMTTTGLFQLISDLTQMVSWERWKIFLIYTMILAGTWNWEMTKFINEIAFGPPLLLDTSLVF